MVKMEKKWKATQRKGEKWKNLKNKGEKWSSKGQEGQGVVFHKVPCRKVFLLADYLGGSMESKRKRRSFPMMRRRKEVQAELWQATIKTMKGVGYKEKKQESCQGKEST